MPELLTAAELGPIAFDRACGYRKKFRGSPMVAAGDASHYGQWTVIHMVQAADLRYSYTSYERNLNDAMMFARMAWRGWAALRLMTTV